MKPVNFNDNITNDNIVIKSSKTQIRVQSSLNKQFVYSINQTQEHSPEFFYAIAHIKPPFIDFVFLKVQSRLRGYGATAPIWLFIEEDDNQTPQVILECIEF